MRFFTLLALCFLMMSSVALASSDYAIGQIHINGSKRIEETTVHSYLGLKAGQHVSRGELDRALKRLFATGLFADVSLKKKGSDLIVYVVENPIINQIAYEGNEKLSDDELLLETRLKPRQIFTRSKVQADVDRLQQIYRRKGRFSAKIDPKIIKLEQNRVDLVFEVDEGEVTKVESIRFMGNDHFQDDELRSVITTKESAWYRFISNADRYDPDRLSYDQELLRQFYLSKGYADFNLTSAVADLSADQDGFYVTFTMEEGARYKVRDVSINSHIDDLDVSVLSGKGDIEAGQWYSVDDAQAAVGKITDVLGDLQYAFVNVYPKIERDREAAMLDIVFQIDEAPRAFIEAININGNVRTLDRVIRRELLLVEGDPFNKSKLAESERGVRNLNFFERIDFNTRQGSAPDQVILDIDVEEKSTGEVSLGAGFSTSDGVIGDISFSERNLLGKGQSVRVSGTLSGDRTRYDVSFVEPYFLNRDISAGVSLFNVDTDGIESRRYDERNVGGTLFMNYPLSARWRQTLKYRLDQSEITDIPDTASRFLRSQEGERTTSAISQRVTYDSRDSKIFPTDGYNYWLETEVAGLGFDAKHVSALMGISYYYPVANEVTLNLLAETGAITGYGDEDVEVSERYSLGGPTSLRGFERYGVGPRDTDENDDVGGNLFYRGSVQVSFPLGFPKKAGVSGYAFSDFGSLWNSDEDYDAIVDEHALRVSAGVGVTWRSPFGPVGVYYANPFMDEDYDQLKEFEINFGTRF